MPLYAPIPELAYGTDSKSVVSGFKSQLGHQAEVDSYFFSNTGDSGSRKSVGYSTCEVTITKSYDNLERQIIWASRE